MRSHTQNPEQIRNRFFAIVALTFLVLFLPVLGVPVLVLVVALQVRAARARRVEADRYKVYADGTDNR